MFILFAFIALSAAAVDYTKAKYLIDKSKDQIGVLVLNTCGKDYKNNEFKYEAISATQYKKVEYDSDGCTGNVVMTTTLSISAPTEYEYAETLPSYLGYHVYGNEANCGQLANIELVIYSDQCIEKIDSTKGSKSEKIVKEGDKLVKKYFENAGCQNVLTEKNTDLGTCGQCVTESKKKITCGVYTPPTPAPSGGNTNKVDYNTVKYAVQKENRVDKNVLELRKCSKAEGNKYMKAVATSETKYKMCTYTDDKCTAGETCQAEESDSELVNDLPKHIGYSVISTDAQCSALTDASFTIYVEGCIASNIIQGGTHEKAVIEGGKLKIKSYTDDKCTKENPESTLKERAVQECGKCNGESQRSAMKCQVYGSSGSIQTFVLFALTILLFLF